MTNSGSFDAFTDVPPRTRIVTPPPGSLLLITCTPATLAWISSSGETMRPWLNSSVPTVAMEPVTSFDDWVPYPMMTICANCAALACSAKLAVPPASVVTVTPVTESGEKPMRRA